MSEHLRRFLAVSAIFLVSGCAGSPTGESTAAYVDDTIITTRVKSALLQDKEVSGAAINVETDKGAVQLSGFAQSTGERERAMKLAKAVPGVKTVWNDIRLK